MLAARVLQQRLLLLVLQHGSTQRQAAGSSSLLAPQQQLQARAGSVLRQGLVAARLWAQQAPLKQFPRPAREAAWLPWQPHLG
jgi:hypothetical protein